MTKYIFFALTFLFVCFLQSNLTQLLFTFVWNRNRFISFINTSIDSTNVFFSTLLFRSFICFTIGLSIFIIEWFLWCEQLPSIQFWKTSLNWVDPQIYGITSPDPTEKMTRMRDAKHKIDLFAPNTNMKLLLL